jgi:DNA-binding transcriptional ArsR family regulator
MSAVTTDRPSELVKAGSHPLRMRIMREIASVAEASPNELSKLLEESLPLISYHVRILRELGCVELVRETPRRGAIEHHYRVSDDGRRVARQFAAVTVPEKVAEAYDLLREARELDDSDPHLKRAVAALGRYIATQAAAA